MTAPTRPPRASQPYPVAEAPEPEHTDGGWASVLVAAIVAAVAIAVAGVIAGLVVVNLRESAMGDTPRTTVTSSPVAAAPAGQIPAPLEITVATEAPALTTVAPETGTLDQAAVQSGVVTVLSGSYGLTGVGAATCPAGQAIVVGAQFACSVTIDGEPMSVSVTITSTDGVYEVSRPF
ncbi:DUF4333 domain-containing protein [Nocardia higoensis]|uniref:DUF4333 domain-containing protein n=1 Tax=Nocardia higoensis TaxID=228599 RepID=A0ABS0D683_9NOCA|nr:DUF4333 domain-containing protein [Nocardia higoensis]MBF6353985.1 DUF4333 domain-containing protein [Nocardia higoensis]